MNPAAIADGLTRLKNTMKNYEMDCIYIMLMRLVYFPSFATEDINQFF